MFGLFAYSPFLYATRLEPLLYKILIISLPSKPLPFSFSEKKIFLLFLLIFDFCYRLWGVARLLGLSDFPPHPNSLQGIGSTCTTALDILYFVIRLDFLCGSLATMHKKSSVI